MSQKCNVVEVSREESEEMLCSFPIFMMGEQFSENERIFACVDGMVDMVRRDYEDILKDKQVIKLPEGARKEDHLSCALPETFKVKVAGGSPVSVLKEWLRDGQNGHLVKNARRVRNSVDSMHLTLYMIKNNLPAFLRDEGFVLA